MLTGSELTTAIAAVLIGAILVGVLLHWLWGNISQSNSVDRTELDELAMRLHDADLAREAAEDARERAEALLARREADTAERMALMQARLGGAVADREAELTRERDEARLELEAMRDGLGNARQRIIDLETQIEALGGNSG
jgi:hypothetical protein